MWGHLNVANDVVDNTIGLGSNWGDGQWVIVDWKGVHMGKLDIFVIHEIIKIKITIEEAAK